MPLTEIQQFYKGKSIFVTGGTGFMGKVLVEKLLYTCSDLDEIFILMRPKRGNSPAARLEAMFKLPIFQRILNEKPDVLKKLVPVQGDITFEDMGLSGETLQRVLEKTNIIVHLAATLKLDAALKDAININLTGTKRIINLAKQMKNLECFLHLSTAFCYSDHKTLPEEILECPQNPENIISLAIWTDDKTLERSAPYLMSHHPNTYIYTKRLAEALILREHENLPCAILRPSIVSPSFLEPVEGWVDSLNGPIGVMVGTGKGVIRSMLCNPDYPAQSIPVDMAINGIITSAYRVATMPVRPERVPVFNMTSDDSTTISYGVLVNTGQDIMRKMPFEMTLWYPNVVATTSRVKHTVYSALFHWLPAYFIDFLLLCFGQTRFMCRVQKKVSEGLKILEYFTNNKWDFKNEKFLQLYKDLSPEDKKNFNMDPNIDIPEYLKKCILGARQFCVKDPLTTIPKARRQVKILWVLDKVCKLMFFVLIAWAFLKVSGLYSVFYELLN